MTVVVQNDVAVPAVELPVCGGVHRHFVGAFNSPDLQGKAGLRHGVASPPPNSGQWGNRGVTGHGYTTG